MKDYRQSRRRLVTGLSSVGLLTVLPLTPLTAAQKKNRLSPLKSQQYGLNAAPLPQQSFPIWYLTVWPMV